MNRETRRDMQKKGASKENLDLLQRYDQPCKIVEVVKLARAISEDVVEEALDDYRRRSTGTIIALTLQLEILRDLVVNKSGLITEEEFKLLYEKSAKEFEDKQREYLSAMKKAEAEHLQMMEEAADEDMDDAEVKFSTDVNPVELKILPKEN